MTRWRARAFPRPARLAAAATWLALALAPAPGLLAAPRGPAIVQLRPAARQIHPGDIVTVAIRIQKASTVGAVPFTLRYDPALLELVASSPTEGEFLRQGGAATSFIARAGSAARGGGLVVGLARLGGPARGARGQGTLCRVAFRALRPGAAVLSFSRAAVLDPAARPMPATFTGATLIVKAGP